MAIPESEEPRVSTIELELPGAPPARFKLLWDAAPKTCAAVTAGLPDEAECLHAIYSGTIAAFYFDPTVVAPIENATTCVAPGDLIFTHYEAGTRHGHPGALSEVYWPYDRYARPTIPGKFITLEGANVFGTFDGPADVWQAFAARCERLRYDGTATIQIRTF